MGKATVSFLALGVAVSVAGSPGCSPDDASPGAVPPRPVVVRDGTSVIGGVDGVVVEPERLVFSTARHPEMAGKKAGEVLVGDRSMAPDSKNPDGFLRKVISVETRGDQIVVMTSQASILDVVSDGKVQAEVGLTKKAEPGPGIHAYGARPGLTIQGNEVIEGPEIKLPELDETLDIVKIEDKPLSVKLGGKSVPLTFTAKVNGNIKGSIAFSPKLDLGLDIVDGSLKELHTIFRGSASASMTYGLFGEAYIKEGSKKLDVLTPPSDSALSQLMASATGEELEKYSEMLKSASEGSLLSWKIFEDNYILGTLMLGPVPVPMSLNVAVVASCSPKIFTSASLTNSVVGSLELGVGARYTNYKGEDAWSPVFEHGGSVSASALTFEGKLGASLECSIRPSFGLIFYGLAGPTVWVAGGYTAEGGLKFGCDNNEATASAYLNGNFFVKGGVGAKLGVFLPGYSLTLKETELTLATWNVENAGKMDHSLALGKIPAPICGFSCSASTCQVGQFDANGCVNEASIKVCSVDAQGCATLEPRDCKGAGACFADPRSCACGSECPAEGAVGSCAGPGGVMICRKGDDGCLAWKPEPCKTSDVCFGDPKKCATGEGAGGAAGSGGTAGAGGASAGGAGGAGSAGGASGSGGASGEGGGCGVECPGDGAVGACTGPSSVQVCRKGADGCLSWEQQGCKTSLPCFEDATKCAQGGGCAPKGCGDFGGACGAFDDGCGGTVSCGCPSGQQCQGGACVSPPACKAEWQPCSAPADCCEGLECKKDPADNTLACQKPAADPCASASQGDGKYCGAALTGGSAGTLYGCSGGATSITKACAQGCTVCSGAVDVCWPSPCPGACNAAGTACGSSADCCSGLTCTGGVCKASCSTEICGGVCCPAGTVKCGSKGECCDGVTCVGDCPC